MLMGPSLFTIGAAAVARVSPTPMVGKTTAAHFAWVGIVGAAVDPTLVATLSDRMFAGLSAIDQSLSPVSRAMSVIAPLGFGFPSVHALRRRGRPL
jgi:hypothetical protein